MRVRSRARHFPPLKAPGPHPQQERSSDGWWRVSSVVDGRAVARCFRAKTESAAASQMRRELGGRITVVSRVSGPERCIEVLVHPFSGCARILRVTVPDVPIAEAFDHAITRSVDYLSLTSGAKITARADDPPGACVHIALDQADVARKRRGLSSGAVQDLCRDLPDWVSLIAVEGATSVAAQNP